MKTAICILAASAIGALSVPVAGATIPGDSRSGYDNGVAQLDHAKKAPATKVIRYDQQAYVPGGSSQAVAKAIVSQGKRALR